jgi:glycosyltransferase involved in cell wall biosynthesis
VSVVVPVYGSEAYLPACLASILGQSFCDVEVIVVDDGSPGDVAGAIAQVPGSTERVRVIRHERNRGASAARLTGASAAKGEYIGFVDSDDLLENDFLETLFATAVETGAEVVECAMTFVRQDGSTEYWNPKSLNFGQLPRILVGDSIFAAFLQAGIWTSFCNKLFRSDFWRRAVPGIRFARSTIDFGDDLLCMFGIFRSCRSIAQLDDALYRYLWRANSISTAGAAKGNHARVEDLFLVHEAFLPQLAELQLSPELKAEFVSREFADVVRSLLADQDAGRADDSSPAMMWARDLITPPLTESQG